MKRRYEMVLVAAPSISEDDHDRLITAFEELIAERGGEVLKVDRWGRRKLAYPVEKFQEGNYTLVLYDAESDVEHEIVRRLKLSDNFLRFLSVRADHEKPPTAEEKLALEENRKEQLRRAHERPESLVAIDPLADPGPQADDRGEGDSDDDDDWDDRRRGRDDDREDS